MSRRIFACCRILMTLSFLLCALHCRAQAAGVAVNIRAFLESDYAQAFAEGVIDAPPDAVWRALTDYQHLSEYMPGVKDCRIVSRTGNRLLLYYKIGISIFSSSYTAELTEVDVARLQRWHAVAGDFKINSGSWRLLPENQNKTRLFYEVKMSHKWVPDFLIIKLLTRRLPEIYEAIQQQAMAEK